MPASDGTARPEAGAGARIPLPDLAHLNEAQQKIANEVAAGPRGEVRGPVRVWLHSPELANRAQKLGEFLRWDTVLEPHISELVILVTARHYNCHYIWFNHVGLALKGGLSAEAVERIKQRQEPSFASADEAAAYDFTVELLRNNAVSDATLLRARDLFGDRGAVEIGAIVAHYHSGAIVLGLADIVLPDGSKTCLPL
ncbi:MAG TPA: carboxymuconolactone decarboxylase family protein [Pseudolabrys sp.]|nr:carboxymuconolactone decarboxylase family protein [Pseudolabrys sp.]